MLENRQNLWPKRLDRWVGVPLVFLMALKRPLWRWIWSRSWLSQKSASQNNHPELAEPIDKLLHHQEHPASRILVIKLSALGDLVVMLPALALLSEKFQGAQFDFLGGGANEPLARRLGFFKTFYRLSRKSAGALLRVRYDLVIDFDQWVRVTALIAAGTRSKNTIGFKSRGQARHWAFDFKVGFDENRHNGENFWNLVATAAEKMGFPVSSTFENACVSARAKWREKCAAPVKLGLTDALGLRQPYVVFHPGCGEHGQKREWPAASWAALVREVKAATPALQIVISGHGEHETNLAYRLVEAGAKSLVGQVDLAELMTILTEARLVVACNTGIMHLASFLNDHVISINGPTDVRLWGPLWKGQNVNSPLACSPCLTWGYDYGCSDPVCVKVIRPDNVYRSLNKLTEVFKSTHA